MRERKTVHSARQTYGDLLFSAVVSVQLGGWFLEVLISRQTEDKGSEVTKVRCRVQNFGLHRCVAAGVLALGQFS